MEAEPHENGSNGSIGRISGVKRPRTELSRADGGDSSNGGGSWVVKATREAHECINPVRSCEEKYFKEPMEKRDMTKSLIKLSIGEWSGLQQLRGCLW